ncbi:helix-turn-helix transcriptional regulator [Qipengyuania nanhaisediminis]|uniref:helix-turn-helix transcriptional regulator n=1 Tax=Qipengyuania nanhaisediminis TaxID=604088 RepID=UPI0038B24F4A
MNTDTESTDRRELPKRLIYRERDLKAVTNTSRKFREDAMKAGTFPKPVPLGPKARGWLVSEIEDWIEERKAARDAA